MYSGMDNMETPSFPNSVFSDVFSEANDLNRYGFAAWVLYPGMEFGAQNVWWGGQAKRARPHEGVDLRFYRGTDNRIFAIDEGAKIPVMYSGVIVKIIGDFLGKTIIIEHRFPDNGESVFLSLYGHTSPVEGLETGRIVKTGEIIAAVAASKGTNSPAHHLHLSLAWSRKPVLYGTLDWTTVNDPDVVRLVDPRPVIGASENMG